MIYFIQAGRGPIKIGYTADCRKRLAVLQAAHWKELTVRLLIPGKVGDERNLHVAFAKHRIRGEWYRAHPQIVAYIESQVARSLPVRHPESDRFRKEPELRERALCLWTAAMDRAGPAAVAKALGIPESTMKWRQERRIGPSDRDLVRVLEIYGAETTQAQEAPVHQHPGPLEPNSVTDHTTSFRRS